MFSEGRFVGSPIPASFASPVPGVASASPKIEEFDGILSVKRDGRATNVET